MTLRTGGGWRVGLPLDVCRCQRDQQDLSALALGQNGEVSIPATLQSPTMVSIEGPSLPGIPQSICAASREISQQGGAVIFLLKPGFSSTWLHVLRLSKDEFVLIIFSFPCCSPSFLLEERVQDWRNTLGVGHGHPHPWG